MKSSQKAKVAIITRTRTDGREIFLRRALETIKKQTFANFVHVVINNGGDRQELERILRDFPANNRIVIHNEDNRFIASLNQGVRACESEYVAILDDDDTWHPDRLKKTVEYLDKTKKDVVVVKMDVIIEEMEKGAIKKVSQHLHPESGEGEISLYKQCFKNYLSNGIVTYTRRIFEEVGGYDETLPTAEDWDFGIRLLLKTDVGFLRDEEPLFFYHQRPKEKGASGNSVHAGVRQQEETIMLIRNRYLRKDLTSGTLGVGYIMNSQPETLSSVVRLEGHMNHVGGEIEVRLSELHNEVKALREALPSTKVKNTARSLFKKVRH